jgi:hypothetical protein
VIGQFPWEPFPPGEPDPKGPDPVHSLAFRAAVTAADAYHAVRLAVRREAGTLRVGNRFVPDGRYREVAFLALGNAANSMALGALHAIGDRLTQGFLAGPDPVLPELPFRGVEVSLGWPGDPAASAVVTAAKEIAGGLTEQDLLLVLLSPGALRVLAEPPEGMTPEQFSGLLEQAYTRGATGREVGLIARVLGTGGVGGRLASFAPRADVATLLVDRGDGPTVLGGGPMQPVSTAEQAEVTALLARLQLADDLPAGGRDALRGEPSTPVAGRTARPVVVTGPADALRAASDAVFDKGWTVRLAFLEIRDGPEAAAERFLERAESLYRAESLAADSRTKGVAAFAMATLGLPEGLDEGPALGRFLSRAHELLRRREMSVGLFRTGGDLRAARELPELLQVYRPRDQDVVDRLRSQGDLTAVEHLRLSEHLARPSADRNPSAALPQRTGRAYPPGAVVGAPTEPGGKVYPNRARAVRMRSGITDVGCLAIALYPRPEAV